MSRIRRPLLLATAGASGCILIAGLLATVTGAASTLVRPSWVSENCTTEGSTLTLASTAYAVTPQEVVDDLGTRTVGMIWHDRDESEQVTITIETEATEVKTLTDSGCNGVVLMPVTATLTSETGRLDESFSGNARVRLDDALWTVILDWTTADPGGTLPEPDLPDNQTFERFGFQIRFGEESTTGGVRAEARRDNDTLRYLALGLIGGDSQSEIEDGVVVETDPTFEPIETPDGP